MLPSFKDTTNMNRLILVRHGGSTANEQSSYYALNDSAICLTNNGIRQALNTGAVLSGVEPRWSKPGNFALEAFASEFTRARQTARITLDRMGLLALQPRIRCELNERDYGTAYDPRMDADPYFHANQSESSAGARPRLRAFLAEAVPVLSRADVIAFSHMGAIRALIAEILGLSDAGMMARKVDNGEGFRFVLTRAADGKAIFVEDPLPVHLLSPGATIDPPP
jgi:broad specificity phosphatase PhoE